MSCSTKLTIYGYFVAAFFPQNAALAMISLYVLGIVLGIVVARVSHSSYFKGEAVPFVMELPNYRLPSLRSVGRLVWDKSKDFLTRAFTVIFVASVVVWVLQHFTPDLRYVEQPTGSLLAVVGGWVAPLLAPLGFADWRIATSLIVGFLAKETVVSTCTVLFGSTAELASVLTPLTAYGLLVFCLLYTPCVAAIAAVRRELGNGWAWGVVVFQCGIAWMTALVVRLVGMALGLG